MFNEIFCSLRAAESARSMTGGHFVFAITVKNDFEREEEESETERRQVVICEGALWWVWWVALPRRCVICGRACGSTRGSH